MFSMLKTIFGQLKYGTDCRECLSEGFDTAACNFREIPSDFFALHVS